MSEIRARLEQKARADFAAACGQEFLVESVSTRVGLESVDIACEPPARVRVVPTQAEHLARWNGDWLDPRWSVEPVVPHPALARVSGLWVFGASYHPDGGSESPDVVAC